MTKPISDPAHEFAEALVKAPYIKLLKLYTQLINNELSFLNEEKSECVADIIKQQMMKVAIKKISASIPQSTFTHFSTLCEDEVICSNLTSIITKAIIKEAKTDLRKNNGNSLVNPIMLEGQWNFTQEPHSKSICDNITRYALLETAMSDE